MPSRGAELVREADPSAPSPDGDARGGVVSRWWRTRETPEHGGTLWLALTIGIVFLLPFSQTSLHLTTSIFIMATCLGLSLRWRVGWLVLVVIAALGIWIRVAPFLGGYSDVLTVTKAAIARMLAGESPYGFGYPQSLPPGAPFNYGPVSLLWYLPFRDDPRRMEFWVSVVVLVLLVVRGGPLGLAIYAFSPNLVAFTIDGSNDTSSGLFLLAAVTTIPRAPVAGGALLAVACAFKLYLAAWVPALLFFTGTAGLVGFVTGSILTWGTALVVFGLASFLEGVKLAGQIFQSRSFWSLGWLIEWWSGRGMPPTVFNVLRVVLGAIAALATRRRIHGGRDVAAAGLCVFLVTLYTGYWSSFSYLAAVAPLVCWYLDDWVGLGDRRVRWTRRRAATPSPVPVGAVAAAS